MKLNQISDNNGARKVGRRLGRGIGSGKGKTSGRGVKGQKARTGVRLKGFEGGQMPLHRRIPKRGFKNHFRRDYNVINLDRLQGAIDSGKLDPNKPVDSSSLVAAGLFAKARDGVRLLGKGELKTKLQLHVEGASKSAIAGVEKAGGAVVVKAQKAKQAQAEA